MSIRKRTWISGGSEKTAWVADYKDQHGKRCLKTFKTKKAADSWATTALFQVKQGTHTADSTSVTVAEAGEAWIKECVRSGLEPSTLKQYREHLRLHINPLIGNQKLSKITVPVVKTFMERLGDGGTELPTPKGQPLKIKAPCSDAMVKKVISSLGALFAEGQESGLVAQNPVRQMRRRRKDRRKGSHAKRHNRKLRVGTDIPNRKEARAIMEAAQGRWRPFLVTAFLTGLRASELRGLRWADVDLDGSEIHVRQRADYLNTIGSLKSETSERSVLVPPMVINVLKEWRLACPKGKLDLVFPTGTGKVEAIANIHRRGVGRTQMDAGVTVETGETNRKGEPTLKPKYSLHKFRHFYASWLINRKEEGGLGLPPKMVQERLGHSSINITVDLYGHLFPVNRDHHDELAAAEAALFD